MSCTSCRAGSEPEAFGGVEVRVVEDRGEVVGVVCVGVGGGRCCGAVGVSAGVVDGDLVQEQELFDGAASMLDGHASVVAQEVSDLGIEPFQA
ncbi:hypothetical protein CEP17_01955 [Microbacterium sp. PM5]|nr:hypothetical protein CEP17_01955 [Microbacterium sp. PM5]